MEPMRASSSPTELRAPIRWQPPLPCQVLRTLEYDLIIAGMQSTDGDNAQVGPGWLSSSASPRVL